MEFQRYKIYTWSINKLLDRSDCIKFSTDLAARFSRNSGTIVVVEDLNCNRICAYGYKGKVYWASPCIECEGIGCESCLEYGFKKQKPVCWLN